MKFIEFTFENSLYQGLFSLSELGELILLNLLEAYPMLLIIFFDSISLLFLVLLENISLLINKNIRSKSKAEEQKLKVLFVNSTFYRIQQNSQMKTHLIKITLIILLGLLSKINSAFVFTIYLSFLAEINGVFCFFNFLLTWFLLRFWVRQKMHKHHIVALALLFITLGISLGINFSKIVIFVEYFDYTYMSIFTFFFGIVIIQSVREVLEKYMFDVIKINHFRLLFYEGVVLFSLSLTVFGLLQLFDCSDEDYDDSFGFFQFCRTTQYKSFTSQVYELFSYQSIDTLYAYIYILSQCSFQTFRVLINNKLGPSHRYSADQTAFVFFSVYNIIKNRRDEVEHIFAMSYITIPILLFVGSLIYNENILIHICNLSFNTRAEIKKRAEQDLLINESIFQEINLEQIGDYLNN